MELNLVELLRLNRDPDVMTTHAAFYCHVPAIAAYAYLHTIYAPASDEVMSTFGGDLDIPDEWRSFLMMQNGANLFSNALSLYGVSDPKQLNNRSGNYSTSAFSLHEYQTVSNKFPNELQIGSYGYDGALVLLSRIDGYIQVVSPSGDDTLARFASPEAYLREECGRLGILFSESGELLTDEKWTVPVEGRIS